MKRKIAAAVGVGVGAIQRVAARSRLESGHDLDAGLAFDDLDGAFRCQE